MSLGGMAELVRLQPPGRSNTNHTREKGKTMTERTFRIQTGHWHANHGPLERVGKQMVNDSLAFDYKDLGDHYWTDRDAKLAYAVKLAKAEWPDWENYEPRHTNGAGVIVVVRKWVAA